MKVEMTGQIFVKFFSAKFPKYLFSGFQVIKFLQTDRRTDGRSNFHKRSAGMRNPLTLVPISCSEVRTLCFPHSSVGITRPTTFFHAKFAIVKYCRISQSVSHIHCCVCSLVAIFYIQHWR
jgi:hypothetical protein